MKPKKLALFAAAAMTVSSAAVFVVVPAGGFKEGPAIESVTEATTTAPVVAGELGHFETGATLHVEGRLGKTKMLSTANGEELVMIDVKGASDVKATASAPSKLAIVIDRSGSMKGSRIRNAINAAITAVDRLRDGDLVTVLAFDTQVKDVVTPTEVNASSRSSIENAIRGITLGGDTCISCGIERGMTLLDGNDGRVARMIVLSDGDANNGIRDVPGFRSMAQRSMQKGLSITTIGVDVDYNEKIMAAIAEDSNGRHYFVDNDSALPRVFEAETDALNGTIANNVEVAIDLAPGVELDRVFERSFRRSGNQIIVPLGAVARGEEKTVLLKVRVPRGKTGASEIASVDLGFKDLVSGNDAKCSGKLAVEMTDQPFDEAQSVDPVVLGRAQRSETVTALKDANRLFEQGKIDEANRRLALQGRAIENAKKVARASASPLPANRSADVDRDFEAQATALNNANQGFATPPVTGGLPNAAPQAAPKPDSRAGKGQIKTNVQKASELSF